MRIARSSVEGPTATPTASPSRPTSRSAPQLGPVSFRLDQLGLGLVLDTSKPQAERNLRFVDARLGAKPAARHRRARRHRAASRRRHDLPRPGAGHLLRRARRCGSASSITLKAIGLVATRHPDGTPGSSFIVIATVEHLGWQIGPVTARRPRPARRLGPHVRRERRARRAADRPAAPRAVPGRPGAPHRRDPAAAADVLPGPAGQHAARPPRQADLRQAADRRLDLALIFECGRPRAGPADRARPGQLDPARPTTSAVVQLNLDAVGVFDFERRHGRPRRRARRLASCAVASRSPARRRFRGVPGVRGFALGRRRLPPPLLAAARVPGAARACTVALTNGDNPKLICQAYVAITANTVQFGADASLYAAACGFSIDGQRRLRRADPALAAALPRRVPRQRAAQAGLDATSSRSRSRARSRARSRCGSPARRRSRSSGGTSRSRSTRTLVERRRHPAP